MNSHSYILVIYKSSIYKHLITKESEKRKKGNNVEWLEVSVKLSSVKKFLLHWNLEGIKWLINVFSIQQVPDYYNYI